MTGSTVSSLYLLARMLRIDLETAVAAGLSWVVVAVPLIKILWAIPASYCTG